MNIRNQNARSGFSLVEMMVAIAIFMVVAVIAVAALLKIVDANRKSETLQDAVNNINFAMDSITREVRVGTNYNGFSSQTPYSGSGMTAPESATFSNECVEDSGSTTCTTASSTSIVFSSSNSDPSDSCNLTYSYAFVPVTNVPNDWTIEKAQQTNCSDSLGISSTAQYAPIIDPSIVITDYNVNVNVLANTQPSVFIYIRGYTGNADKTKTYFDIQTTISQRT